MPEKVTEAVVRVLPGAGDPIVGGKLFVTVVEPPPLPVAPPLPIELPPFTFIVKVTLLANQPVLLRVQ